MFNLFRKKSENFPEFWNSYAAQFEQKPPHLVIDTEFVVFDTETTGFDYSDDRILSIGAVKVTGRSIDVSKTFEYYLHQEKFNADSIKIHGILQRERSKGLPEEEAIERFLKYIGNSVLVAHHAGFDVNMINAALKRMKLPPLKNAILDTGILYKRTLLHSNLINREKVYSLDEIAEAYFIETKDRHTATGDAFITALAFLKILGRLDRQRNLTLKKLFRL